MEGEPSRTSIRKFLAVVILNYMSRFVVNYNSKIISQNKDRLQFQEAATIKYKKILSIIDVSQNKRIKLWSDVDIWKLDGTSKSENHKPRSDQDDLLSIARTW